MSTFEYRGIRITRSFDDERSAKIGASMREAAQGIEARQGGDVKQARPDRVTARVRRTSPINGSRFPETPEAAIPKTSTE